ncbi:MAG: hypothetical protein IPF66_24165 [Holophagales bacterium]|nr:hypothetical protein [Holophagales bacterium]
MSLLQRGLMFVLAAGTLVLPPTNPPGNRSGWTGGGPGRDEDREPLHPGGQGVLPGRESRWTSSRPGLKVTIGTVTDMAPGKKPIVELR